MKLTPELRRFLPTAEDVAFYQRHGYYISPRIFDEEEMDEFIYGMERYYAGERDYSLPGSLKAFEGWKSEDGDVLRINDYVSLQNEELSNLVRHPLIGAIAARLSGSDAIRLWHDQMIYKPADREGARTGIGWHTDRAYWQTCSSDSMLTAWIPFHDCTEEMGTLTIVDESHQWTDSASLKGFHQNTHAGFEKDDVAKGRDFEAVPMNLRRGQISFHHCCAVHGSGANRSERPRRSLSIHLQDSGNRYRAITASDGEKVWHRNDMLCRIVDGTPDYSDPDFCPLLWSETPE